VAASCIKGQAATSNNRLPEIPSCSTEGPNSISKGIKLCHRLRPRHPPRKESLDGTDTQRPDRCSDAFRGEFRISQTGNVAAGNEGHGLSAVCGDADHDCAARIHLLYAIPRTCVLGAILLTGYFGGAIATHVRLEQPAFVMALSIGVLAWLGIYLRDARLRALLPLRT
jgi:hypothetical protein